VNPGRSEYRGGMLISMLALLTIIFLVTPQIILLIESFTSGDYLAFPPPRLGLRWYWEVLTDETWRGALIRSLLVAMVVTPVALVLGTSAAFALDRGLPGVGRPLRAALVSPMVLPHVVLGLAIYRVFLPVRLDDTIFGFIIAHLLLCVPYVIVIVGASLQTFDRSLEEVAQSLGASPWQAVFHVTLRVVAPALLASGIFAFITSFDEFIVTYFLATRNVTVPIQIFSSLSYQLEPSVAAVSGLTLIVTIILCTLLVARGTLAGQRDAVT
jgi:putative spermidine/putrescine transport system permease protein